STGITSNGWRLTMPACRPRPTSCGRSITSTPSLTRTAQEPVMHENTLSRGATWLAALTDNAKGLPGYPPSVRVVDAPLAGQPARYIAVVPDSESSYPRARTGETG